MRVESPGTNGAWRELIQGFFFPLDNTEFILKSSNVKKKYWTVLSWEESDLLSNAGLLNRHASL